MEKKKTKKKTISIPDLKKQTNKSSNCLLEPSKKRDLGSLPGVALDTVGHC